jgi:hypothetical protein
MCGIAMQAAHIPGPYYSTKQVVSRQCIVAFVALAKPVGYTGSSFIGRKIAMATALAYPTIAEFALALTGPELGVILFPYALDEISKSCACEK